MDRIRLPRLTIKHLCHQAAVFAAEEAQHWEPSIYGRTDGKAVGTYIEQKFTAWLSENFRVTVGNSTSGIDLPELNVDIKVTSLKQPQSSCPYRSARQKVYGLGYNLLIFVYEKADNARRKKSQITMSHIIFVEAEQTGDYQTTRGLRELIAKDANHDDILAYLTERNLPLDDVGATLLAEEILRSVPPQGFLTISNALQWRLQYGRVIEVAGIQAGVFRCDS